MAKGLLNQVSIRTRLLVLVLIPLFVACYYATTMTIKQSQYKILLASQLERAKALSALASYNHSVQTVSITSLQGRLPKYADLSLAHDAVDQLKSIDPNVYQHANDVGVLFDEMTEPFDSLPLEDPDSLIEWRVWVDDLSKQLALTLEKYTPQSGDDGIDQRLGAMFQLMWLQLWSQSESWQLYLYASERGGSEIDELFSLVGKQQDIIERFINISATPGQIEMLLETFSKPPFSATYEVRQLLLNEQLTASKLSDKLSSIDERAALINNVNEQISSTLVSEINQAVNLTQQKLIMSLCLAIASICLMVVLGWNVFKRIAQQLETVLETLSRLTDNTHHVSAIPIEGRDEFTEFADRINSVIQERTNNEARIIQARDDAEQANKAKSSFLANMSHEIRTPLNGIIGMSNILADTALSPTQADYVQTIETSSHTLLILINDILDLSKIESGNLNLSPIECNIREVIYDTATMVIPKATESGLAVKIEIDDQIPHTVLMDDHRLRQILMNLMSNAVKFTKKGTVSLRATVTTADAKQSKIKFSIVDTGIGIDTDKISQIFKPFTQEDGSITRQFGGTGLGLAICQQLVELMGGNIEVKSEKGKGSEFFFTAQVNIKQQSISPPRGLINKRFAIDYDSDKMADTLLHDCHLNSIDAEKITSLGCVQPGEFNGIILCFSSLIKTKQQIIACRQRFPAMPIIVTVYNANEHEDFANSIQGLITLPLLGQRLVKTLRMALEVGIPALSSNADQHDIQATAQPTSNAKRSPNAAFSEPCKTVSDGAQSDAHDQQDNPAQAGANPTAQPQHVLLVEDNIVNQKVAGLMLKRAGYNFSLANNGEEAVDELTHNPDKYKVILMDCMMPVMDGFTATQRIRVLESKEQRKRTPIIALTASVLDEDVHRCFEAGMDDYMAKPFKPELLVEKLDAINL